jgi:tetratricopeptide (TPR) repeat protein
MPKRHWSYVDDPLALGERLKEARERVGLSQRQLAFPGCSAVYISRIERGERVPSLQLLRELGRRLGVHEDYLATGEAPPQGDPLLDAEVALRLDHVELAEHLYTQALQRGGDDVTRARALAGVAQLAAREGNLDDAVEPLEEAYALLGERSADYPAIPETLGTAYAMRGEFESALAVFESALDRAREREDEHEQARFQILLANTLIDSGNIGRAEEVLGQTIGQAREATNPILRARIYWSQSRLHTTRNNHELASRYARKALAAIELTEHSYYAARLHHLLAYIELERGNAGDALELLRDGFPLIEEGGNAFHQAQFRLEEARALAKLGRNDEAADLAVTILPTLEEFDRGDAGRCYALLGDIFSELGQADRALGLYDQALEHLDDRAATYIRDVYSKMAQLLEREGRKDEALEVLKKALQLDVESARHV